MPQQPYEKFLEEPNSTRLLETIPWVLDSGTQGNMMRTLKGEAGRLRERADRLKISVVVPMYNTIPRYLEELIFSMLAQTWWNWELLLVDDGSPRKDHLG